MISEFTRPLRGRRPRRFGLAGRGGRVLIPGLAAAAAALVAACGSGSGIYGASGGSAAGGAAGTGNHAAAPHGAVVSARALPGVGTVLVGRSGTTLYSPQQEAHGKIMCTGGCLSFWLPVSVAPGATLHSPTGVTGVLGTIHRPDDGVNQLTYNGRPLYTFRLDQAPGQARGNNVTDHFGSASFTWHAVTAGGALARTAGPGNSGASSHQGGSAGY